jgi:hypothetical protein
MPYVWRITQRYLPQHREAFLNLEKKFVAMEKSRPDLPQGRRLQPVIGGQPTNTFIWEADFPTLEQAARAATVIQSDQTHETLFREQVPYMLECFSEIYEILDL